ncbi:uncharacterized protein LOC127736161 [Mytilus californianus]|uniref:uncharacterized protein LOC127736161 n=1 Tax=Mytilus californianus TaxID=6549 RepID=UPI002245EEFA|nr:uncharacterized protein LOC127736161 [Mytilus californianus]XP_052102677.1 uncharacterized protein LOC127736161 [Mytilus californianus]XP_052102678.1 uncharacterized protein LOC127736161 [Mytilus californianus]
MATSASWTLWKRLPPRYQLSVRTFVDEDDLIRHSPPGSPKTQRRGSPRHPRSENKSPRPPITSPTPANKRSIQNIPEIAENENHMERPVSPSGSYFPYRKSGYIDHFKTQQRVNSARAMMVSDDRSRSPSPNGRMSKTSAPDAKINKDISMAATEIQHSIKRCEHHKVQTEKEDQDTYPQYSNKIEQRKYLVRETDEGTMYIDKGKIIYFRRYKSSPVAQTSNLSRYNDGGYLASIRREYLTKPRLLAMGPRRKTFREETKVFEEREKYNRKVANILDYYSYPDEDNISLDDLTKYTSSGRKDHSPRKHANMSPKNVKRIYFAYPKSEHEVRSVPIPDIQNDPGSYFKVNQQSKLHDRNFYLKTPGHKSSFRETNILDCACGMCRIEMQLALMAQAETESHAKFQQSKMLKAKSTNKENDVANKTDLAENDLKLDLSSINKEVAKASNVQIQTEDSTKQEQSEAVVEVNKQEQTLTVTIPKMETNREISEVARENEANTEIVQSVE